jgi:hypothetical protein
MRLENSIVPPARFRAVGRQAGSDPLREVADVVDVAVGYSPTLRPTRPGNDVAIESLSELSDRQ